MKKILKSYVWANLRIFRKGYCPWNCRYRQKGLYNSLTDFGRHPFLILYTLFLATMRPAWKKEKVYVKRWVFEETRGERSGRPFSTEIHPMSSSCFCCKPPLKYFFAIGLLLKPYLESGVGQGLLSGFHHLCKKNCSVSFMLVYVQLEITGDRCVL